MFTIRPLSKNLLSVKRHDSNLSERAGCFLGATLTDKVIAMWDYAQRTDKHNNAVRSGEINQIQSPLPPLLSSSPDINALKHKHVLRLLVRCE